MVQIPLPSPSFYNSSVTCNNSFASYMRSVQSTSNKIAYRPKLHRNIRNLTILVFELTKSIVRACALRLEQIDRVQVHVHAYPYRSTRECPLHFREQCRTSGRSNGAISRFSEEARVRRVMARIYLGASEVRSCSAASEHAYLPRRRSQADDVG